MSVCLLDTLVSPAKTAEPIFDRDADWGVDSGEPWEQCVRWGTRSLHGKGQFLGVVRSILQFIRSSLSLQTADGASVHTLHMTASRQTYRSRSYADWQQSE